ALAPRLIELIEETHGAGAIEHTTVPQEALRAIARSAPDVVVVEVQSPASPGLKVLRALRAEPARPWLVVLADDASPEARDRYASAGADYVFDRFRDLYGFGQTLEMLSFGSRAGSRSATRARLGGAPRHR
ncbi:MAG: response regulator, partial [Burkholderiales bacterium]